MTPNWQGEWDWLTGRAGQDGAIDQQAYVWAYNQQAQQYARQQDDLNNRFQGARPQAEHVRRQQAYQAGLDKAVREARAAQLARDELLLRLAACGDLPLRPRELHTAQDLADRGLLVARYVTLHGHGFWSRRLTREGRAVAARLRRQAQSATTR